MKSTRESNTFMLVPRKNMMGLVWSCILIIWSRSGLEAERRALGDQGDIREVPFFPQSGEGGAEIEVKVWPVERKLLGSFHSMQQFKTHWLQAGKTPIILGKSESDFLKSQGTYMSAESELIFELKLWCMAVNHLDRTDRPPPTVLHNQRSRRGDQCFMITEQKGKYQTFLKISHPIYIWSFWNKGLPSHPSIKHQDQTL